MDHGNTNAADGAPLCGKHKRWKTRGYSIRQGPEGTWHTLRPDGTAISSPPRE